MTGTVVGRPFRFGVVATPRSSQQWLATARSVAEFGYSTLLMPDGMQLPAPLPALALAAGAEDIRVGTWVLAGPLRPPRTVAWEAHTLSLLTDGRFELGLGTGRPVVGQWAQEIGLPYGTAAQRLAALAEIIDRTRELDADGPRTPVLVAASGPGARALAAERADIVSLAVGVLATRQEVADLLTDVRERAADRVGAIEIATSIFVVGDDVPQHAVGYLGADLPELIAVDSLALLRGTPRLMADELERRRDRFGMSYVTVNSDYLEQLAPVVDLLAGH